jgi:midasin (ATPase involved in ribosome maturation)
MNLVDQYKSLWKSQIKKGIPLMLVGGTGIGKTEMIGDIAKDMGRELIVLHLARSSASDFLIPFIEDGGTVKYAINENLKQLSKGNIILFFDEYDRAEGATRNAILSLINERVFDGIKLPDTVGIVLAGNQETSRDTNMLNQAELTRIAYYRLDDLVKDDDYVHSWVKYATERYGTDSRITSFIAQYKEMLNVPSEEVEQMATSRGWVNLGKCMEELDGLSDRSMRKKLITSFIGNKAGAQFQTYLDVYSKMPSATELLKGWDKAMGKEVDIDKKIAGVDILVQHIRKNKADFNKAMKILKADVGDEYLYLWIMLGMNYKEFKSVLVDRISNDKEVKDILLPIAKDILE